MSIAILCPTRGRFKEFSRMRDSVKATTTEKTFIYSCTNGDDTYAPKMPHDCPTVYMWNHLARKALQDKMFEHKLFMLCADDVIFTTPGWDKALLDHYDKSENKIHVYALQDSRDNDGTPHPIVTREYISAMGYFLPPIFVHWFVDSWTVAIARANNCFTHMKDFVLTHDKPSDKGQADKTHNHIRRMGWHERDNEVNRTCHHILEWEKRRLALKIQ